LHKNEDLEEKKLLGSGGYAFAYLTEDEELKFSIGVPHLFLGNIGRVDKERLTRYYCNKCGKEYPGSPLITRMRIQMRILLKILFYLKKENTNV
jgi:hypothetical protein